MAKKHTPLLTELIPRNAYDLPTTSPVAVYYRQSTKAQVGNRSTQMQNVDMRAELKARGWADDLIIPIEMDEGLSGQKTIDERPGMKKLYGLIVDREIGAVATVEESRLFRDTTMINPNVFIKACKDANVKIITPSIVYDFCDPAAGKYHVKMFRDRCEAAGEYIDYFIKGVLLRNRHALIAEGRYAGGSTAVGYMVHLKERRYYPFEEYAAVVNEYYRLFLSLSGNLRATYREIVQHGPYYPSVEPPDGFKVDYHEIGRYPSRSALRRVLLNPVYIGHWTHNGKIIRPDNHPGIVPTDVFTRAFNYLSPVAPDGSENKHYRPFREHARPTLAEDRPAEYPLYMGMLEAQHEGNWYNLGTRWAECRYLYVLRLQEAGSHVRAGKGENVWGRNADMIDRAISDLVKKNLRATFERGDWEKALAAATPNYQKQRRHKVAQIEAVEEQLEGFARNLPSLPNEDFVKRAVKQYEAAQADHRRLTAELAALDDEQGRIKALDQLKEELGPASEGWDKFSREKKRAITQRLIERIEVSPADKFGTIIIVRWTGYQFSRVVLRCKMGKGTQWRPEEQAELLAVIELPQLDIAARFPDRTWQSIRGQIYKLNGTSHLEGARAVPAMHEGETYDQYVLRAGSTSVRQSRTARRSNPRGRGCPQSDKQSS